MTSITGKTIRAELQTAMRGLAARHFQKLNPRASEAAAWRWAEVHVEEFRAQAVQFLTMIYLERETSEAASGRVN